MKRMFKGEAVDVEEGFAAQAELDKATDLERIKRSRQVNEIHIAWLRQALARSGQLDAVNAAVAAAGQEAEQLWEFATFVNITDPEVVAIADALSIDLRALFDLADGIRKEREGTKT